VIRVKRNRVTRVKICGVNSPAAFDAVVGAGADYLGFQFFPPSPRYITPQGAAELSARHAGGPRRVGLFVSPSEDDLRAVLAGVALDGLQIYADAARCRALRAAFHLPVWRAVGIAQASDLPQTDEGLDGFIIEAKPPPGANRPGGNATAVDFAVLQNWHAPAPWLLAGGLNPDNVGAAIAATGAPGVDVASGVETSPGVKSPALIQDFVLRSRHFERTIVR